MSDDSQYTTGEKKPLSKTQQLAIEHFGESIPPRVWYDANTLLGPGLQCGWCWNTKKPDKAPIIPGTNQDEFSDSICKPCEDELCEDEEE